MNLSASRPASAIRDFDFLAGAWHSRQRRLKARLQGCTEWETFSATLRVQRLPGGVANFDTLVAEAWRPGWVGMSWRVHNPVTDLWSIYWITNEGGGIDPASGHLGAPVVGRFAGDEGLFEGEDVFEGRPIRVRFRWLRQGAHAARWEQAFSEDGGGSWEVNWVMEFERAAEPDGPAAPCLNALDIDAQVVELRQYTLHRGQRDTLIELFDREFVEAQEAAGMAVMGQFREPDAPDRFVWLRGFADMANRARALATFYDGPVWQRHRDAANATMADSDDVLLLAPAWPGAGVDLRGRTRPAGPVRMARPGLFELSVLLLKEPAPAELIRFCREVMTPCLQRGGATVEGWYVTASVAHPLPRFPVREGVHALVGLVAFDDAVALEAFERHGAWAREVLPVLSQWLARPAENHRLVATARSALHAGPAR